jgi:uncharacterized cupredoxin-like copper-binding protein
MVCALLAVLIVACGAGGGESGGSAAGGSESAAAGGQTLQFVAQNITYTEAPAEATAGEATFVLRNEDSVEHYVVIDELGLEVESHAGETSQGTATLESGKTYTYYCSVPGHRDAGMEGQLTVS